MALAPYGMQDRLAYAGGTPRFNEFGGTTMPMAAPTTASNPSTTSLSSLASGLPSGATRAAPTGGMLKPLNMGPVPNYTPQGGTGGYGYGLGEDAPVPGYQLAAQNPLLQRAGAANVAALNGIGTSGDPYAAWHAIGQNLRAQGWNDADINSFLNMGHGGTGQQAVAAQGGAPATNFGGALGGGGAGGGGMLGGSGAAPGMPHGDTFGADSSPVTGGADNVDWSKLDVSKFLDPSLAYRENEAANVISNGAAARGNLLSGATQKAIADRVSGMAGDAYTQALQASMADRTFGRGVFTNDRDYGTSLNEWNKNFGEGQRQFNNNFGEGQRRFDTGVDQADRAFDYNARVGDRNFNYSSLSDLARMGQNATGSQADMSGLLARLLSANTIASGQAGAQGTLGANNALTGMISQLIGSYGQNSWMDRLFPSQPGP